MPQTKQRWGLNSLESKGKNWSKDVRNAIEKIRHY